MWPSRRRPSSAPHSPPGGARPAASEARRSASRCARLSCRAQNRQSVRSSPGPARGARPGPARDGFRELALGQLRATLDAKVTSATVELLLGVAFHVHASVGLAVIFACPRIPRARIGRAPPGLRLPVIATFLEGVLQSGIGDAVCAFALAILPDGAVVSLGKRALRLCR